ncbi:MAG: TRAP transporter substrate-binding protein [Alphaproteobacteria bacterium]|nr:TRAP transporter substrate-binding protein [Alphaproteobacteria bacterium]
MKPIETFLATALLAVSAGGAIAEDLPTTKFNVVGSIGILSMYKDMEAPFWTTTMEAASNGAIQAQIKPFTELGFKGGEVFNLTSNGTLQLSHTVLPYTSGAVPVNESADLVGVVGSVEELHKVVDVFREYHTNYLAENHGLKVLGYGAYHSQVIYCRDPFTSIGDLKGRKVRAAGASQQAFVNHLGGSPVSLAFGEVQTGLANGVVDCAITGALSGYLAKWHESANYISAMPVNHGVIAAMANLDWWNALDPKVQQLIEDKIAELETQMFDLAATETQAGLACNTGGDCAYGNPASMTLVPVTEEDDALRLEALTSAVLPAFKDRCGDACAKAWNETIGKLMGVSIN